MYKLKLYLNFNLYLYASAFSLFISLNAFANVCPQGTYPVKGHTRTEYYRSDGTHVSSAKISKHCRSYRKMDPPKIVFKEKMPKGWPYKKETFKKWTEKEKKQIRKAFSKLPKILTHIGNVHLFRAVSSDSTENPATNAPNEKIITLYDVISKHKLERVLAHELSHVLYNKLSKQEIYSYYKTAEWVEKNGVLKTNRTTFSAPDGVSSPEEYFANNIEFYLYAQEILKKNDKIFDWIKKFMESNR